MMFKFGRLWMIGVILCFVIGQISAQKEIEEGYFGYPIKHELRLAGTFGELRSNHFHMGIDVKSSNGSSGDTIYAVADGFVSRAKVQSAGYGNGLYIDHPNGYTSVYGHMKSYRKDIKTYVRKKQYVGQKYEVDIDIDSSKFPVKKGDYIGIMGTSGYSFGPHLHFEIRDTKTEIPINPLLCGYKIKDTRKPIIQSMTVYHLNADHEQLDQDIFYLHPQNGAKVLSDTIEIGAWRVGFGVSSYDPMDNIGNKNGIYNLQLKVDGVEVHTTRMDSISFDETRGLNGHIDYAFYKSNKRRYQRCYQLPGLDLRVCESGEGSVVDLYRDKPRKIELSLEDFSGNKSALEFWVKRTEVKPNANDQLFNYILPFNEDNIILRDNFKAYFPLGSLYETLYLHFRNAHEASSNHVSDVFYVHDNKTPLHTDIELFLQKNQEIDSSLLEKVCLVNCNKEDSYESWGGAWKKDWFHGHITELGNYSLYLDTIPPKIKIKSFREDMSSWRNIQFTITDNLSSRGTAKELVSNAYIDGQWILMEYDLKNDRITHWFDKALTKGLHSFRLEVSDDRGNISSFEQQFNY